MSWTRRMLFSNLRPFLVLKNVSSMTTLSSSQTSYSDIVTDTLTKIHDKYHFKNDITFAKTACQAAKFLDDYLEHAEHAKAKENSIFLCHIYHMFVELIFNTLEIVEKDHYTTNTHDLENIHYNIYTSTNFTKHCGSQKGPHGETSLFMISYIAQKIKFDYNLTFEEFQQHASHIDTYISEIMSFLRERHLKKNSDEKLSIDKPSPVI